MRLLLRLLAVAPFCSALGLVPMRGADVTTKEPVSAEAREEIILGPRGGPLREERAECVRFYETRRYEKAAECWDKVIEGGADDVFVIRTLGFSLFYSNRPEDSLHYFDQVLQRSPNDILALKGSGLATLTLGQNDRAELFFERAIRLAPNSEPYRRLYGLSLHRQEKTTDATCPRGPFAGALSSGSAGTTRPCGRSTRSSRSIRPRSWRGGTRAPA
jgi:tetratricopeptide (TPR) repeat protein